MDAMNTFNLNVVVFSDADFWCAQCLEYDVAAQARSLAELRDELERVILAHCAVADELGREPFAGLKKAPQKFWKMFEASKMRLEMEGQPFHLPMPCPVIPRLKIADRQPVYA